MSEKTKSIYKRIIPALMRRGYFDWMSDAAYLKLRYKIAIGRKLDLKNPQTFNEKLQWLKLHDRKPVYTTMVDKYAVKEYVASIIGEEHIIPTLGVWDSFDEIDFDSLPDQFVLKCTHDSGGLVICKDKSKLNIKEAKRKIEKSLNTDYYLQGREWPYKDVPRRIIAEKYMVDESGTELIETNEFCLWIHGVPSTSCKGEKKDNGLIDYKFYCFNGIPEYCQVITDRYSIEKIDFFDMNWQHQNFTGLALPGCSYPHAGHSIVCPKSFEAMKLAAASLSRNIPFSRIDFYEVTGRMYFGEITLFPASGFGVFEPDNWNRVLGDKIDI